MSRRLLIVIAVVVVTTFLISACNDSGGYSIRVVNDTPHDICELYTREAHSYSRRSKNYLGGKRLSPGEEFIISGLKEGNYDIEAELCSGEAPGYGKADIIVKEGLHPTWTIGR